MRALGLVASAVTTLLMLTGVAAAQTTATELYESAAVDSKGNLVITSTAHRKIVVPKERHQSGFDQPAVATDRTAVGAQAQFRNCCTSYDIPLALVVYANGKVHRFTGSGLPILQWHFADDGRRVAYGQEPVHFGCFIHYELREVQSEQLIDAADIPESCGQNPQPAAVPIAKWIAELNADWIAHAR